MPRIDPVKLLSCIGVLLSPNGGIRSATEVKRLAGLMAKYSKKLVSKCIYIQILKCTETELLGQFMDSGGWPLVHSWLEDGITSKNWPLVQELLELLLLCPVDVPRLQSNSAPKLVKGLSREEENEGVRILATRLVEQWLKIARGETPSQNSNVFNKENLLNAQSQIITKPVQMFSESFDSAEVNLNSVDSSLSVSQINENENENENENVDDDDDDDDDDNDDDDDDVTDGVNGFNETGGESEGLVLKITMKNGKRTLAKISDTSPKKTSNQTIDTYKETDSDESRTSKSRTDKSRDDKKSSDENRLKDGKDREKSKDNNHKKSSSSSSQRSSSKSSSSSTSKHSSSSSSSKSSSSHSKSQKSSSSSSSGHKSSSSSSSSRDKEKHKSSKSSSSSSSSSRDKKSEKTQAEKDKDTLAKIQPKSLEKVGKIPKKSNSSEGSFGDSTKKTTNESSSPTVPAKKKSISIEVRKDTENRPKTVKTYNSQFRSHGLAEEAPPPPSRRDLKKQAATPPTNGIPIVPKRSLSPTNTAKELEKKIKLSSPTTEKPGAIKLIPAKPKPSVLVESDMFMDAISAATTKKEVRKRKRIPSVKESEVDKTPPTKESKDLTKAVTAAPLRFYQDTLEENENKEDVSAKSDAIKNETDIDTATITTSDDGETKEKKIKIEDDANEEIENGGQTPTNESIDSPEEPIEEIKREPGPGCGPDGPPGVLTIHRRKGPKKSLRWKPQESLEEVRFFELDETERVNVTKAFVDMKQMERVSEREAFLISRKVNAEDVMTEQMPWTSLVLVDDVPEHVVKSKERDIQAEREKTCLKTIYFNRAMIPDSPLEPDVIAFQNVEPPTIPLFDITGNTDTINDYTNMPWPEPKGSPPHQANTNIDDMNSISNFGAFGQFNNMNWPTQNNMLSIRPPPHLGGLMMPAEAMNPMNINPMHTFNGPHMMGQLPPTNMAFMNNFAPGMPPIMNDNRGNRIGNNWFGVGASGVGNNNAINNWQAQGQNNNNNNNQRQNWVSNRRICKQFQRGFCRHGKNCKFLHPGENSGPKF